MSCLAQRPWTGKSRSRSPLKSRVAGGRAWAAMRAGSAWLQGARMGGSLGNLRLPRVGEGAAGVTDTREAPCSGGDHSSSSVQGSLGQLHCHLCLCLLILVCPEAWRVVISSRTMLPQSSSDFSLQSMGFLDFHFDWTAEIVLLHFGKISRPCQARDTEALTRPAVIGLLCA